MHWEGRSATIPAVLLVEWPNKIRLELQDPVGGTLGLLVIQGENFWLYQAKHPEILTGPWKRMPLGLMPALSGSDLVRVFLARPDTQRFERGEFSDRKVVVQEKGATETLVWSSDGDPEEWRREGTGTQPVAAFYEDFEAKAGQKFPLKVRLEGPGPDGKLHRVQLQWKDWNAYVPKEKKLFEIPQQQTFGRKIKALP